MDKGEGSRDERPLHTRGRGQPSCCSGASTALERAAEARLRDLWECLRDDPTQQFRWTGRRRAGGRAMRWRQSSRRDSDYCLDAHKFSNGKPVQAWECNEDDLEHQIWATL